MNRWRQADGLKPVTYAVDANGCHICTSDGYTSGYPQRYVGRANGKSKYARVSRVVWEQAHGPIPAGLVMRHLCHNRACVNLAHLAIGTPADNARDSALVGKNRSPLTVEQATAIRVAPTLAAAMEMGRQFGITEKSAACIRRGRHWKHLPAPVPPLDAKVPPPAPSMTGAELRAARVAKGLTLHDMADLLSDWDGAHPTYLSRAENGIRYFSPEFQAAYLAAVEGAAQKQFGRPGRGHKAAWGRSRMVQEVIDMRAKVRDLELRLTGAAR